MYNEHICDVTQTRTSIVYHVFYHCAGSLDVGRKHATKLISSQSRQIIV